MISFFESSEKNIFAVQSNKPLSEQNCNKLQWLFGNAKKLKEKSIVNNFIGPRSSMISPWSTNAVEITQNMDIQGISRIEIFIVINPKEKIDLIIGGPPCQAFSTAGNRLSINENRGVVFIKYLELIRELNPTYFVIENVRGLLSVPLKHVPHSDRKSKLKTVEEKGGTLQYILNYLKKCGYKVSFNLYNSANFGTPQIRERVVIIGNKKELIPFNFGEVIKKVSGDLIIVDWHT